MQILNKPTGQKIDIPAGWEAYSNIYENYTPDEIAKNYSFLPKVAASTTAVTPLETQQQTVLKTSLDTEKQDALKKLDDVLAARGISRSGAVGAGTAEIEKNYANALAKGNVDISTAAANQNMMQKYYDAMIKKTEAETGRLTNTTGKTNTIINLPTTSPFSETTPIYNTDGKTLYNSTTKKAPTY